MRNDVHFAALRAAAKVAFSVASVALVNGCSSSDGAVSSDGDTTDETSAGESAAVVSGNRRPSKACHDAGPAKPSCDSVLAAAFPVPGDYQWRPVAQPANVVACCDMELTTHDAGSKYRWDCCVAYDPNTVPPGQDPPPSLPGSHGLACTPWGPPVPPSMEGLPARRRARLSGSEMLKAVA